MRNHLRRWLGGQLRVCLSDTEAAGHPGYHGNKDRYHGDDNHFGYHDDDDHFGYYGDGDDNRGYGSHESGPSNHGHHGNGGNHKFGSHHNSRSGSHSTRSSMGHPNYNQKWQPLKEYSGRSPLERESKYGPIYGPWRLSKSQSRRHGNGANIEGRQGRSPDEHKFSSRNSRKYESNRASFEDLEDQEYYGRNKKQETHDQYYSKHGYHESQYPKLPREDNSYRKKW